MSWALRVGALLLAALVGAGLAFSLLRAPEPRRPDPPALVEKIREVARLETLDVRLYKKVSFEPDPQPAASVWGDVFNWVKATVAPVKGKAIVFADVSLGLDASKLSVERLRVQGDTVEVALPPLRARVELRPGDTEFIGSNLDSAQTARLLELAKEAFEREAEADAALQAKARASAERAVEGLLLSVGFRQVRFVAALPPAHQG